MTSLADNAATSPAGPLVSRRTMLTVSTALGLSGLYAVYAALVNPLIAPPGLEYAESGGDPPIGPPPRMSQHMAERFLPSARWAADAPYQMRTKEAFVYFKEWTRTEELQAVEFRPFAMIWMHNDQALREGPITILAEKATVRFETKFEITNDPGRVIAAAIEGRATIRGPHGMAIDGRDFSYSESAARIWSNEPLTFAHGRNSGSAVGVQVDLLLAEKPTDHSLAVAGMRMVRLLADVKMDLVAEPSDDPTSPLGATKEPTRARVTSDGPFQYDVERLVATYERNVRVASPPAANQRDTLEADKLEITFAPGPDSAKAPDAAATPAALPAAPDAAATAAAAADPATEAPPTDETGRFQAFETNLVFRALHAEGTDVRLRSDERDVTATMQKLDYDAVTRIVQMEDARQVRVLNDGSELRSPAITLVHSEQGSDLQSVWCRGSGWMKHTDPETGDVDLEAKWEKQMKIQPDVESGLEILELEQEAVVRQTRENSAMQAEFIRLWFDRVEQPEDAATPAATPVRSPPEKGDERERIASNLEPRKLLALDRVTMLSPELEAHTRRLEVWFETAAAAATAPAAAPIAPAASPRPPTGGSRETTPPPANEEVKDHPLGSAARAPSSTRRPRRTAGKTSAIGSQFFLSAADAAASGAKAAGATAAALPTVPTDGPLVVDADLIRVRAVRRDEPLSTTPLPTTSGPEEPQRDAARRAVDGLEVREVWTFGNVHVRQTHPGGELPLDVTGERLHVVNAGPNREVLHVYGGDADPGGASPSTPARVSDRGMHIAGNRIHLDRGTNRAWVEGAGTLQLPIEESFDGKKLAEPQPLDVAWGERMEFDGRVATFHGDVRTKTRGERLESGEDVVEEGRLRCAEMHVTLTERVSFADDPGGTQNSLLGGGRQRNPRTAVEPAKPETRPEVATIRCLDGVTIDTVAKVGPTVVAPGGAGFGVFEPDQASGRTLAKGPGVVALWRRGTGRRAGLGPGAVVRANAGVQGNQTAWEYTHIDFEGVNKGNVNSRTTRFEGRVEITYGPVAEPLDVIDPDALPEDGGWMQSETLELQSVEKTAEQPAYFTALATDNVYLRGREFYARADEVSFDESKGRYVLRSKGDREATIWRQQANGAPEKQSARRMEFVPSRKSLKLDNVSGLQGSG